MPYWGGCEPSDNGGIGWLHLADRHALSGGLPLHGSQQRPIIQWMRHPVKPGRSHPGHGLTATLPHPVPLHESYPNEGSRPRDIPPTRRGR